MTGPAAERAGGIEEWRHGYPLVAVACVGFALSTMHYSSLGVMIEPLSKSLGWSRGEISAGFPIVSGSTVLSGPIIGTLIDRIGARRIAIVGVILYSASLALLSAVGPAIWTWYAAWVIMAVCYAGVVPIVWTMAVAGRFNRQRGLALALTSAGSGVGMAITPFIALFGIDHFGWRGAYLLMAAICLGIGLPLIVWKFRGAADMGGARLSATDAKAAEAKRVGGLTGIAFGEAVRSGRFMRLATALIIAGAATAFLNVHLVPLLTDGGLARVEAVALIALIGPTAIAGKVIAGLAVDRMPGRYVGAVTLALPILSCLLLLHFDGSLWRGAAATVVAGLTTGAETHLMAYLSSRYFGMRAFGSIFGLLYGIFAIGYGLAPVVGGHVYDVAHSYAPMLLVFAAGLAISGLLMLSLGTYPIFAAVTPAAAGDE